jgi:hypothetical protein
VRPTARSYRGKALAATAPDRLETFLYQGRPLRASWFDRIVVSGCSGMIFCLVVHDPRYKHPWVLLTDLRNARAETVFLLYRSHWHIEQLPQTAKQLWADIAPSSMPVSAAFACPRSACCALP